MICQYCEAWCARTDKQLSNRIRNLMMNDGVRVHKCPKCGGTEWAMTPHLIRRKIEQRHKLKVDITRIILVLMIITVLWMLNWN